MKKPLRTWLVSLVLVIATPWTAPGGEVTAASAPAPVDAARTAAVRTELARNPEVADAIRLLEAWIESQMAYRGLPGRSLGIVYDQELVWARGFGFADLAKKTPATAQTLYRIASNSKLFTSVAILQLRDEGKLGLDDPVEKHLRWFALRGRSLGEEPVTVRNLLTHTGGQPREAPFTSWTENRFPTREQIEESVPAAVRAYPPYTKWKYSNLGLALAGEIVETVCTPART